MSSRSSQVDRSSSQQAPSVVNRSVHELLTGVGARRRALSAGCAVLGAAAVVVPAQAALAGPAPQAPAAAGPAAAVGNASAKYSFTNVDDPADLTFNQLLGINDFGVIAGYYGSGSPATTHPNRGYTVAPYSSTTFTNEDFPASAQTQVTGINDWGNTVGFYVTSTGANYGFLDEAGVLSSVSNPLTSSQPPVDQLLGLNDQGVAVGFYNDSKGNAHAYKWARKTKQFTAINPPASTSATATAINDSGAVAGFLTEANGNTAGFIKQGATWKTVEVPGSTNTQIFGINAAGTAVGMYVDAHKQTHGFIYSQGVYKTIDDPDGVGSTLVNGLNNVGAIVGFYTDAKGNTDGFVGNLRPLGIPTP